MRYSKRIVTLIIILNTLFAIGVLVVFWHTSNEPSVLIGSWFAFTTSEIFVIAGIKKRKIERGTNE